MSLVRKEELFADEGRWLRRLLADVSAHVRLLPPQSAVDRMRRRLEASMAGTAAGARAA
jgi:hypothetical protein